MELAGIASATTAAVPKRQSQLRRMHSAVQHAIDLIDGNYDVHKLPEVDSELLDLAKTGSVDDVKQHLEVYMSAKLLF